MEIIRSIQDVDKILEDSKSTPVFLLKHSLTCSISSSAYSEFSTFAENHPDVSCCVVRIQENRDASQHIAEISGIRHESPQAILFSGGGAVWNESHWRISARSLEDALT